ncbi:hypothetical protein L1279_001927 [Planomicrobium sp. HSC-17F08]|nr:hypothetical protein [Planomicrobium sp. HSC-17F08]
MVSLLMLFMLFGTLLPVMQQLQQSLHLKKERMIAVETLHEGAKEMRGFKNTSGERRVNGTVYRWEMAEQLCVHYENYQKAEKTICIE